MVRAWICSRFSGSFGNPKFGDGGAATSCSCSVGNLALVDGGCTTDTGTGSSVWSKSESVGGPGSHLVPMGLVELFRQRWSLWWWVLQIHPIVPVEVWVPACQRPFLRVWLRRMPPGCNSEAGIHPSSFFSPVLALVSLLSCALLSLGPGRLATVEPLYTRPLIVTRFSPSLPFSLFWSTLLSPQYPLSYSSVYTSMMCHFVVDTMKSLRDDLPTILIFAQEPATKSLRNLDSLQAHCSSSCCTALTASWSMRNQASPPPPSPFGLSNSGV
jgi:hypothetical protein